MAREFVNVYAGLGANLGHASQSIESAILALGKLPETLLVGRSSFYSPIGEDPELLLGALAEALNLKEYV